MLQIKARSQKEGVEAKDATKEAKPPAIVEPRSQAKEEGNYQEVYNSYLTPLKEAFSVLNMARMYNTYYTVNEVIDPRETRAYVIKSLRAIINKREPQPPKKRFIKPA